MIENSFLGQTFQQKQQAQRMQCKNKRYERETLPAEVFVNVTLTQKQNEEEVKAKQL